MVIIYRLYYSFLRGVGGGGGGVELGVGEGVGVLYFHHSINALYVSMSLTNIYSA